MMSIRFSACGVNVIRISKQFSGGNADITLSYYILVSWKLQR